MTSHKDILADWADTCDWAALAYRQYDSDQDSSEYANECADGCQWVVYYGRAWDLVSAVRLVCPRDLDQAESDLEDLGYEFDSLDKTMTLLAYQLTYNEILTQIQKQESDND